MKKFLKKLGSSRFLSSLFTFFMSAEIDLTSVAVAYYLLVSIFPILMLMASLVPFFDFDVNAILEFLETIFPARIFPTVSQLVINFFTKPSTSWLWVSIFSTLYTFTRGMNALQKAFNKAYGVDEHRDFIMSHVIGVFVGILLQFLLTVGTAAITIGDRVVYYLQIHFDLNPEIVELIAQTQFILYIMMFVGLIVLYMILPNVRIGKIRYVLPGTFFVLAVMAGFGHVFGMYLDSYAARLMNFRFVTTVVILIMMLWFLFLANILILGAVLNATFQSLATDEFVTRKGDVVSIIQRIRYRMQRREELKQLQQVRRERQARRRALEDEEILPSYKEQEDD